MEEKFIADLIKDAEWYKKMKKTKEAQKEAIKASKRDGKWKLKNGKFVFVKKGEEL